MLHPHIKTTIRFRTCLPLRLPLRYGRQVSDFGFRISDFGFRISDFGFLNNSSKIREKFFGIFGEEFFFTTNSSQACLPSRKAMGKGRQVGTNHSLVGYNSGSVGTNRSLVGYNHSLVGQLLTHKHL